MLTQWDSWDTALLNYHLSASPLYISCLEPKCGHYFSIEDCKKDTQSQKKEIECPYCDYALCTECNRPWHAETECDMNKEDENGKLEAALKQLKAKPCPKCGANITKSGGCPSMRCKY